jgi:hypothetical protein
VRKGGTEFYSIISISLLYYNNKKNKQEECFIRILLRAFFLTREAWGQLVLVSATMDPLLNA